MFSSPRRPLSVRRQLLALSLIASILYSIIPLPRFASIVPTVHAAAFATSNVVVYRVGAIGSSTTLSTAAAAVFLDEYTPSGTLVQSIALPTTATTSGNRALTAAGSSGSEGLLTRSTDGRYLILTGYNATTTTAAVAGTTSASTNRVVGRVDAAGTVDTTTALTDAYSGGNIRSATSTDGSSFYLGGSNAGVRYATLGATTSSSISTTQSNIRQVNIFNNQLYASSGSGTNTGVNKVGNGVSNASGQTTTIFVADAATNYTNASGVASTTVASPYGFVFTDANTLYVADDRAVTASNTTGGGGGLQKYTSTDGTNFTLAYTLTGGLTAGLRSVTATTNSSNQTVLYATSADTLSKLVTVTDTGSTSAFTTLTTATTNTAFRGVALAPVAATPVPGTLQFSAATYSVNENVATATITVTRTGGSSGAVSVTYATSNGTATAGSDYTATTGTLTFNDGDSASKTFTVPITDDALFEGNETVNLTLSAPTGGATLGTQRTAVLTIIDNETPQPGTLQFSASTYSVAENGSTATITVTRTGGSDGSVSVNYATSDGSATSGSDYMATSGTLTFANGDRASKTFTVTIIDDSMTENNETVNLALSSATGGATLGTPNAAVLTIIDDDITITPIYTIQGSGTSSSFVGQSVTTTGIVTGRKSNGFFLQDPNGDGNDNTSDAVLVFTSTAPSSVAVGNSVRVTGTVTEFKSSSSDEPVGPDDPKTLTEITSPTIVVLSASNTLPAAKDASIFTPNATSRGAELEKYESMLVSVSSLTVSEPTNNNFGEFWGVATGQARPFREPGIERGDPIPAADQGTYAGTPPPNPPIFDGNFERILVDSDDATTSAGVRRAAIFVSTGAIVTGITGPLDYANDNYRISLGGDSTPNITPGILAAVPVPVRAAGEFTIGHANLENFGTTNTNFSTRLNKASLAVRNVMRTPDILGLIEILIF